jgi:hypothetical protein
LILFHPKDIMQGTSEAIFTCVTSSVNIFTLIYSWVHNMVNMYITQRVKPFWLPFELPYTINIYFRLTLSLFHPTNICLSFALT